MGRELEVWHGNNGRMRSAQMKTEDGNLKRSIVKMSPLFCESVFREKNGQRCWRQSSSGEENRLQAHWLRIQNYTIKNCDENLEKPRKSQIAL